MKWTIEYKSDTGQNDSGIWGCWTVGDETRTFKCESEDDARWLMEKLREIHSGNEIPGYILDVFDGSAG